MDLSPNIAVSPVPGDRAGPSPGRVIGGLVVMHVMLWTLVPAAVNRNLPLDTIEALAWGHEWQWGYDKHPPLSAWLPEIFATLGFGTDAGLYLLSQLCVVLTLLTVYRLASEVLATITGQPQATNAAMAATLVLEGIFFFNYTTPEFNVNVIQMPLWAIGTFCFWRATRTGSLGAWSGLGICAALAALSKYLGLTMLVPMAVYAVWSPRRGKIFRSPGPYLAAAVCLLMLAPHVMWMIEHDFKTLRYGLRRAEAGAGSDRSLLDHLVNPLKFAASMAAIAGGAVALFLFAKPVRRGNGPTSDAGSATSIAAMEIASVESAHDARRFALMMAVGPVLTLALLSLFTGMRLRTMWATPMLSMTGIALAAYFPISASANELRRFTRLVLMVLCVSVVAYGGVALRGDREPSEHRTSFPGPRLAAEITRQWRQRYASPLPIVIGDEWYAGSVAWYSPDRPRVYLDGDRRRSPWLDDEEVRKRGAVIVWVAVDQDGKQHAIFDAFPDAVAKRFKVDDTLVFELDWRPRKGSQTIVLHAAFVAPR